MPSSSPPTSALSNEALAAIGAAVRTRRKALGISAVAAAEAAGISRPTLHRIEKGGSSVTMGATMQVLVVLGLTVTLRPQEDAAAQPATVSRRGWLPARIRITDYPWLKQLAWQLHGPQELTPREAMGIYERNARHLDTAALAQDERDLVEALQQAFGDAPGGASHV